MKSLLIHWSVFALGIAGIAISSIHLSEIKNAAEHNVRLIPPPVENIERMSFGYNDLFADSLWLRAIQNLDDCKLMGLDPEAFSPEFRPQKLEDAKRDENLAKIDASVIAAVTSESQRRKGSCAHGWSFQMLDGATRLAPRFDTIYRFGATNLAVVIDDFEGASILFDRGVKNLPEDWVISYRAAYHFLFNIRDFAKAAALLEQAHRAGAPLWLQSLSARLYTQAGQAQMAIRLLEDIYEKTDNESAKQDLKRRITALRKLDHP